jgi:hypothetical protein
MLGLFWLTSRPAQADTAHSLPASGAAQCTPDSFVFFNNETIYDNATHTPIGYVELLSDGCGSVLGWANAFHGKVTNLEIRDASTGATLTKQFTYHGHMAQTVVYETQRKSVYAWGVVVQDVSATKKYRGEQHTTVYSYTP